MYSLGYTAIRIDDLLRIYKEERLQPESVTLMVIPPVIELPSTQITPGGWLGKGKPRSNAPEQTVTAISLYREMNKYYEDRSYSSQVRPSFPAK